MAKTKSKLETARDMQKGDGINRRLMERGKMKNDMMIEKMKRAKPKKQKKPQKLTYA